MKKNQRGFGAVELVLIVVVIGLLGAVGWLVYDRQQKEDSESTKNSSQTSQTASKESESTTAKAEDTKDETADWKTYTDNKWKFLAKYPSDWTMTSKDYENGGADTRLVTYKSSNFKSDTASVIEVINTGAMISVESSSTKMTDFSTTGLKSNSAYKETKVDNIDAVYFLGKGNSYSYSLIKEGVMYTISLRTVLNNTASENVYKPIFENFIKSFEVN